MGTSEAVAGQEALQSLTYFERHPRRVATSWCDQGILLWESEAGHARPVSKAGRTAGGQHDQEVVEHIEKVVENIEKIE